MGYKIGDIVLNDFREAYDRETYLAVIVAIKNGLYKVEQIKSDRLGKYYFTGNSELRAEYHLTKTGKTLSNLN